MGMGKEPNVWDVFSLLEDFKNDMKQLLSIIASNKGAVADLRKDFKKFLSVMDKVVKEENMRTFRKFVKELERFNKNVEKMSKEIEEMKDILNELEELVKPGGND